MTEPEVKPLPATVSVKLPDPIGFEEGEMLLIVIVPFDVVLVLLVVLLVVLLLVVLLVVLLLVWAYTCAWMIGKVPSNPPNKITAAKRRIGLFSI